MTFNVTQWPEFSLRPEFSVLGITSASENKVSFDVYEHQVQRVAQMILSRKVEKKKKKTRKQPVRCDNDNRNSTNNSQGGEEGEEGQGDGGEKTERNQEKEKNNNSKVGVERVDDEEEAVKQGLRVLAIGCNTKTCCLDNVHGTMRQLIYLPGVQVDPFGDRSMIAVSVKASAVKFVEPDSDILEYRFPDWSPSSP